MSQATHLASEKAEIVTQLYKKLDLERTNFDADLIIERKTNEDLIEQVNNLKYSLETTDSRCSYFEERYITLKQELGRSIEDEKSARQR
jgi:hypothetical protein